MSSSHSTGGVKPEKPYLEFPLYAHANGLWAKRIRGKIVYFGKWEDPDAALAKYQAQAEDLHAGRKPRPDPNALVVRDIADAFLLHKQTEMRAGRLSPRTWLNCKAATDLIVQEFGKKRLVSDLRQDDFTSLKATMSKTWGAVRVRDFVQRVRSVFKYAYEARLIDAPMRFGPGFDRPSKKTLRIERAKKGPQTFEAAELRKMLAAATVPMKALILLGANCGFGNADCGSLPLSAVNLKTGWIDFPRPKTGVARRCPLWKETVKALKAAIASRPAPNDPADAELVFITSKGGRWHKSAVNWSKFADADWDKMTQPDSRIASELRKIEDNPISKEMRKLLNSLDINGHRNFYALRHTFRSVADESRDQPAVDFIMGHESGHMSAVYRHGISDDRLRAVAEYVRVWLFGGKRGKR